ncbi:MAG: GNAT family N-acetyltransferase [Acidobacteriota bacterium]
METRIYRSIDELGADRVMAQEGGGLDFSYGLLRAVERTLWGRLEVRYLTVEDGGETVLFTPVYIGSNLNFNALLPKLIQSSYASQVENLGMAAAYTVAVVGCLISDRGWIPMHPELRDRAGALRLLLAEIDRLAASFRAQLCLLKDIHQSFPEEERGVMRQAGFSEGYSLPTIRIDTRYDSWDQYLSKHLSKNGRKHARKQFRHAEARGYRLRAVEDFESLIPRLFPLFRSVFLRAKYQFEELPPAFLVECNRSRRPLTEMILCEKGDEPVGAMLVFYDRVQQLNRRIGVDYDDADSGLIYNLLNYQGLIRAIDRGIEHVDLGQSSYLVKTRMGGELTDNYLLLKSYSLALKPSLPFQKWWMNRYRAEQVLAGLKQGVQI